MMKKLKDLFTTILLLAILSLLVGLFFYRCENVPPTYIERTDTLILADTAYIKDTLVIENPIPKYIEILKVDTFYTENGDTVPLATENKIFNDTLCNQNDSIILESSITCINPTLDYIKADWRRQEITNVVEITKYIKEKPKKFSISPQLGAGYGIFNKRPDIWIGIGINYNF